MLGGNKRPSEPPVVTSPSEKRSLNFSSMSAGYSRPPTAMIVMPLPPVNVVKNADASRHTTATPPGIQPKSARVTRTSRVGVPLSASK